MSISDSEFSVTVASTPMSSFSTLSSSPVRSVARRHNSRFSVQIVVFEAGGVIFEVPRYGVPQSPPITAFEARFPCPREEQSAPGSSIDNPILVDGVSESDFCSLLTAIYPPPGQTALLELAPEEWTTVFRIAKMFNLELLREAAFKRVDEAVKSKPSIEKIAIGRQLNEVEWIRTGSRELAVRNRTLTQEERDSLATNTYVRLLELRDHLNDLGLGISGKIVTSTFATRKLGHLTDDVLVQFLGDEVSDPGTSSS
ncbi:unnamed protein product [Peniophora sp. CBMAI 1063]|nr:unnamed protein product [Peniophora sp. CBMAI 1063]